MPNIAAEILEQADHVMAAVAGLDAITPAKPPITEATVAATVLLTPALFGHGISVKAVPIEDGVPEHDSIAERPTVYCSLNSTERCKSERVAL